MDFLEKLDFLMAKYNLNKLSLSQNSGIPYTTIVGWYKKGYEGMKLSTLRVLSDYFNTVLDYWVLEDEDDPNYWKANGFIVNGDEMGHIQKYRLLDTHGKEMVDVVLDKETERMEALRDTQKERETMEAATLWGHEKDVIPFRKSTQPSSAGTGVYLGPDEFEIIYVKENELTTRGDFAVPVSGNSMEPTYHDGDILIIEAMEDIPVGKIGIFTLDGDGYVKERGKDSLISLNPQYDPIPMREGIRCNGRVIGILEPEWVIEK